MEGGEGGEGGGVSAAATVEADPRLHTPAQWPRAYPRESAYRNMLADRLRGKLFELLGPECAECGCDLMGVAWEVNHIHGRDWKPREVSRYRRNLRYWREAREGLVNLLCPACNSIYKPRPKPEAVEAGVEPF